MVSWKCSYRSLFNHFTPKSDQFQISPAASAEILHHTVWRTWLFIAYLDERWLYYQFSLPQVYISLLEGWENALFELGIEKVNRGKEVWLMEIPGEVTTIGASPYPITSPLSPVQEQKELPCININIWDSQIRPSSREWGLRWQDHLLRDSVIQSHARLLLSCKDQHLTTSGKTCGLQTIPSLAAVRHLAVCVSCTLSPFFLLYLCVWHLRLLDFQTRVLAPRYYLPSILLYSYKLSSCYCMGWPVIIFAGQKTGDCQKGLDQWFVGQNSAACLSGTRCWVTQSKTAERQNSQQELWYSTSILNIKFEGHEWRQDY